MTLLPKLSDKELSIPERALEDVAVLWERTRTLKIFTKPIQQTTSGHGVVKSNVGEEYCFQQS